MRFFALIILYDTRKVRRPTLPQSLSIILKVIPNKVTFPQHVLASPRLPNMTIEAYSPFNDLILPKYWVGLLKNYGISSVIIVLHKSPLNNSKQSRNIVIWWRCLFQMNTVSIYLTRLFDISPSLSFHSIPFEQSLAPDIYRERQKQGRFKQELEFT